MAIELTIAGASGLKALAAAKAAAAAAKQAAANAVAMAQNTNLASAEAMQAQANLEKYVFGSPVSTVPPVVTPMPPATIAKYPSYPYLNYPLSWTDKVAPLPMMPPHLISEHPWMHGGYLDRQVAHASFGGESSTIPISIISHVKELFNSRLLSITLTAPHHRRYINSTPSSSRHIIPRCKRQSIWKEHVNLYHFL